MDSVKRRGTRRPPRRLVQLYAALLYNAHLKGFAEGEIYTGLSKAACVPGLNCYSCPAAVGACPLGALQNALAAAGSRPAYYIFGILLLFGLTLGRTVCGWLCPMGLLQELLHRLPTPKIRKSAATRALSLLKYAVLLVFVIALPLWYGLRQGLPVPAFCKYLCPAGTLEGAVGLLSHPRNADLFPLLGLPFTRKLVILLAVGLGCVFCYRAFCRFLCPLGAIYSLFSRLALIGVKVDAAGCVGCGACARVCPMDVRLAGDRECIHCACCVDACPTGAISLKAGRVILHGPGEESAQGAQKRRRRGRLLWAAALILLCAALLCFNLAPRGTPAPETAPGAVGSEPADFRIACLDGGEFHLAEMRGRVVVINLWATYCEPCVKEMPLFCRFAETHAEDAAVLAVHPSLVTEDVAAYAAARGWTVPIAVDPAGDPVWSSLGGDSVLPRTVVLDREGRVVYNQKGSVTAELLEELYARASG